jgi:hypothetical protein
MRKPPNHRHRTQANLRRGQTTPEKPAEVPAPDIGYEQEAHHQNGHQKDHISLDAGAELVPGF